MIVCYHKYQPAVFLLTDMLFVPWCLEHEHVDWLVQCKANKVLLRR